MKSFVSEFASSCAPGGAVAIESAFDADGDLLGLRLASRFLLFLLCLCLSFFLLWCLLRLRFFVLYRLSLLEDADEYDDMDSSSLS